MLLVDFQTSAGLLDLFMGTRAGLIDGLTSRMVGLLASGFLILEDLLAGLTEALFVVGGTGFGGCDVGAGFFHGTLGTAAAFRQYSGQGPIDQHYIKDVEHHQKNNGRHASEQ